MINLSLALELRDAGLEWRPEAGDRFVVTSTEMIDDLFHLADMVVEARQVDTGTIFSFNGTTEWALDSVPQENTVWLPHEAQLRSALGDDFIALERVGTDTRRFRVTARLGGSEESFVDSQPENAYGQALLARLTHRSRTGLKL